ncbi:Long-chain-fatty-acid--CoA ligase FadD13 [compost metagenome]
MLTHLGLVIAAMNYVTVAGLRAGDRASVAVPMTHVTGISGGLLPMLLIGGAVLSTRAFKAKAFLERAAADRMTFVVMVPAMYALCLLQPEFDQLDLSAWRVGGYGGAPMAAATIERLASSLPGLALINCYGSTETAGPQAMCPPGDTLRKRDCVGRAIPTGEIIIMDEDGVQVPLGEIGEIWIRGASVAPGYWKNPEATAKEFQAGFWKSGDLGSIDAEGFVRVLDRKKDMLNRGGYKIYSSEVEHVMMAFPGVVEAAIIAKPCPVLGERVHAVVMVTAEIFDESQLQAHCASALSNYKVPETFTVVREPLPRNANGKLMKRELRENLFGVST